MEHKYNVQQTFTCSCINKIYFSIFMLSKCIYVLQSRNTDVHMRIIKIMKSVKICEINSAKINNDIFCCVINKILSCKQNCYVDNSVRG